jgi:SagB-type dehydrogenase family enzyme
VSQRPAHVREAVVLAEQALALQQALDPLADEAWQAYGVLADVLDAAAGFAVDEDDGQRSHLRSRAAACRTVHAHAPRLAAALARLPPEAEEARALLHERIARCLLLGGRGDLAQALAPHQSAMQAEDTPSQPAADIVCEDTETIEWIFEPDLLLEGGVQRHTSPAPVGHALDPAARPRFALGLRTTVDEDAAVRFRLPPGEPVYEQRPGCMRMTRVQRDVRFACDARLLWVLTGTLDGDLSMEAMLDRFDVADRGRAAALMQTLVATGVLDVSGRTHARHLHTLTKKGVLPGGQLENDEVLRLATDHDWRRPRGTAMFDLDHDVPPALAPFHALTRARRSRRDYSGARVTHHQLSAVLQTACGVTGQLPWHGRTLPLRAYPSSGALYAVEIYAVLLRVQGLPAAVCHYRPEEGRLAVLRDGIDPASLAACALPVERQMVEGAAAMICMTGNFKRHERKYGEGGYRMLVAEVGHLSQNLVLAATALGLAARPFGGVFDALMNRALGLDGDDEQFLLAVLLGQSVD